MTHMTRFVLSAAMLVIPATAFSQAIPVPPVPPAPPAAPAPVVAPTPPMPVEIISPGFANATALDALWAAEAQIITAEQARGMSQQAIEESRRAMDAARVEMSNFQNVFVSSSGSAYDTGLQLMSRRDYERAITRFDQVVKDKGSRADGAMYHKAYALYRLGRSNEATSTLADLRKSHPQSRYLKDASALETTIRQSSGQAMSPEAEHDEELKLLAINALVHTDPERALPLLEGVINGGANSLQLKTRAIFVLSQSSQPRAKEILMGLAKGGGNPDVQARAIQYLATRGRERVTSAELKQIYDSTTDADIKRAVITALGSQQNGEVLVAIARQETNTTLKRDIVQRLSNMPRNKAAMDYMLEILK